MGITEEQAYARGYRPDGKYIFRDDQRTDGGKYYWVRATNGRFYNLRMEEGAFSYDASPNAPSLAGHYYCVHSDVHVRSLPESLAAVISHDFEEFMASKHTDPAWEVPIRSTL